MTFQLTLVRAAFTVFALFLVTGCEDNAEKADIAQAQVATANQNMKEMEKLETDLTSYGMPLNFSSERAKTVYFEIKKASLPLTSSEEALKIKATLEAYILRGEETLSIANRDDVHFNERPRLEIQIANAKAWLADLFPTYSLSAQEN